VGGVYKKKHPNATKAESNNKSWDLQGKKGSNQSKKGVGADLVHRPEKIPMNLMPTWHVGLKKEVGVELEKVMGPNEKEKEAGGQNREVHLIRAAKHW